MDTPKKRGRPKKIKAPTYILKVVVNEKTSESEGDDLGLLMQAVIPPTVFKTRTDFMVKKENGIAEKSLNVYRAKMVFSNRLIREFFVNSLIKSLG